MPEHFKASGSTGVPGESPIDAATLAPSEQKPAGHAPWAWAREWEFWLALALGAFLRLWQIGTTQFLDDQTRMMALARAAVLHGAIPLTSIPSSIGSYNPPLSIYLLLPFAALTASPLPAVLSVAVWNVLGVALTYIFTERYFGRTVAAVGALLFAAGGAAVNYSRFLWPPNYIPTLLLLWALTLFAGCVRGERRWFAGNVVLLAMAILLHPTAALLAPVTLVALLLAPRAPKVRAYVIAALGILILLLPSVIFQVITRGYDLRKLAHYALQHSHFDPQVGLMLYGALDGPHMSDLGSTPAGLFVNAWGPWVTGATFALVVLGWVVLTALVLRPVPPLWRAQSAGVGVSRRLRDAGVALWRGLRADAMWRAHLLLWLWMTVPLAYMLRHSTRLYVHYLLVVFPVIFIVAGFAVKAALDRVSRAALPAAGKRALGVALAALVAMLTLGSGLHFALYIQSLADGQFTAYTFYGYPLDEVQQLSGELAALQRRTHTTGAMIVIPDQDRYRLPEQYLLSGGQTGAITTQRGCLALPASGSAPALALALTSDPTAHTLLASLPGARPVSRIMLAGGAPVTVYEVPPVGALPGDVPGHAVAFTAANGNGLRLEAAALDAQGMLRLWWGVIGGAPASPGSPYYRVMLSSASHAAAPIWLDCTPSSIAAGQTLVTWQQVPASMRHDLVVSVLAGSVAPDLVSAGPLTLLTDRPAGAPLTPMRLASGGRDVALPPLAHP